VKWCLNLPDLSTLVLRNYDLARRLKCSLMLECTHMPSGGQVIAILGKYQMKALRLWSSSSFPQSQPRLMGGMPPSCPKLSALSRYYPHGRFSPSQALSRIHSPWTDGRQITLSIRTMKPYPGIERRVRRLDFALDSSIRGGHRRCRCGFGR